MNSTDSLLYITALKATADIGPDRVAKWGFPAGHNGPYHHPETAVRTTGHWAVTSAHLWEQTGERRWRELCEAAGSYLTSRDARPEGFTFHHRSVEGKDSCNGVIGSAWTIEALTALGRITEDERYIALAEDLFLVHPFDWEKGLWRIVDIDGHDLGFDNTFNHQLWLATAGACLPGDCSRYPEIRQRVQRFLDLTDATLFVYSDGLIYHFVNLPLPPAGRKVTPYHRMKSVLKRVLTGGAAPPIHPTFQQRIKWVGYHHFSLYALGRLKMVFPNHPLWNSDALIRAVALLQSRHYKETMEDPHNVYGFGYNAPFFEIPWALSSLGNLSAEDLKRETWYWRERQLEHTYDSTTGVFSRGTADPVVLTARIYELAQVLNAMPGLD